MAEKQVLDLDGFLKNYRKLNDLDMLEAITAVKKSILNKSEGNFEKIKEFVKILKFVSNNKAWNDDVRKRARLVYKAIESESEKGKTAIPTVTGTARELNQRADSANVAEEIFKDLNNPEYRQYAKYVKTEKGAMELVGEPNYWSETQNYTDSEKEAKELDKNLLGAAHYPKDSDEQKAACKTAAEILTKSEALDAEIGKDGVKAVTKELEEGDYEGFKKEYQAQLEKNGKDPNSSTFNAYLGNVENSGILETTSKTTKRIWHLGLGIDLVFKKGSEKFFEWQDPTQNPPPIQFVPMGVTLYFQRVLKQWAEETETIDFAKKETTTTSKNKIADTTQWYQMAGAEFRSAVLFKNVGIIGKLVVTGDEQSMRFDFLWKEPEGGVNYTKILPNHILEFKGFKMSRSTPAENIEAQYNLEAIFGGEVVLIAKWLKLEQETALKLINGQNIGGDLTVKMKFDPGKGFQVMLFGITDYSNLEKVLRYGGGAGAVFPITEGFDVSVDAQYARFMDFNPAKKKLFEKEQDDVQANILFTFTF